MTQVEHWWHCVDVQPFLRHRTTLPGELNELVEIATDPFGRSCYNFATVGQLRWLLESSC